MFYRRRLPHFYPENRPLFITFCLRNSLSKNRVFHAQHMTSGQTFAIFDRLLDEARSGYCFLRRPAIAELIVEALHHGITDLDHYVLHAFVVMPNHIHLLITPNVSPPKLLRSLKGITAKRANLLLGRTGIPFWQAESYDRVVRNGEEFARIRRYIELNPVRAGLVVDAEDWPWSSAFQAGQGAGRGPGDPPYI